MRLTAIRLSGFKSFADKTLFPVDAPLTGILGPNGCGKSNIIDAVRWVLGESTAKQLRGQAMSDVIFAGSASRRASKQAYVELHFDNSLGQANGAFAMFAELVIRREVDSEGQSRYLINQKRCRRKDIVELLQGSGVGARSYAVIEQGMISRIIEAKPEDLRSFIEEAAGIAVYQNRRKESERRMAQVIEHLARHDDRLYSLQQQRDRLNVEAENAQRYRSLQRHLSDVRHYLDSWRLHRIGMTYGEQQQNYQATQATLAERMAALSRDETLLSEQRVAAQSAERALAKARALQQQAREALRACEHDCERQEQQQQHANDILAQQQHRRDLLTAQQHEDSEQLNATRAHITQHKQAVVRLSEAVPEQERRRDQSSSDYDRLRLIAEQQQRSAAEAEARHRAASERQAQLQRRLTEHRERLKALDNGGEDEDLELEYEEACLAKETQQMAFEEMQAQCDAAAQLLVDAENALTSAQQDKEAALHVWQQAQSRAETLREWQQESRTDNQQALPTYQSLLDGLEVDPLWQHALEAFLGAKLQSWHDDEADRTLGLHYGHSVITKGKVALAWQDIIHSHAALEDWLGDIVPLPQHDADIDLTRLDPQQHYLTLDGTQISAHAIVPAFSDDSHGTLARMAALKALNEELPNLTQALHESEAQLAVKQDCVQQKKQQYQSSNQALKQQEQALAQANHHAALLATKCAHQKTLRSEREQMRQSWQREITTLEQDLALTSAALEQEINNDSTDAVSEDQLKQAAKIATENREAYQNTMHALQAAQQALSSAEAQEAVFISREQRNQRDQAALEAECRAAMTQLEKSEEVRVALAQKRADLQTYFEQSRQALHDAEAFAQEQQQQWRDTERAISETKHQIELDQVRSDQLIERLERSEDALRQLREQFLIADRKPLNFPEGSSVDESALIEEVQRYSKSLEALGAVNHTAVEAFAEVDAQYQTLKQQCDDLRNSIDMLSTAISELDEETRERLSDTMDIVNGHFAALFPRLFRGGEAALQWTGDDVLEAGISIRVRPPGKNVKNLSVLSGGEKALTAIALVFALFRLNPAPFCLLDEVDAPLDDGNVNRLTALLRDMSDNTQFIIITHHKNTMQACDHLIGVTMSEPGISRLVAVKMQDE